MRLAAQVASLAETQHAIVTLPQLVEVGLSTRAVQQRAATDRLFRIYRTVYSLVPPQLLTARGRWIAAVFASGDGAVLSHQSAAALHELRASNRARIDVTSPGRSYRDFPGVAAHRSSTLTDDDVTTVDGIPVTTIARTLLDLAGVLTRRQLDWTLNQAEVSERLNIPALTDQIERNHHTKGARGLREALDLYAPGNQPTESPAEDKFAALVEQAGLPTPQRQVHLDLDDGLEPIRADFLWREQRLIVEVDGAKFHGTRRAFEEDRLRDQRLIAAGWTVIRVTARQLKQDPQRVIGVVARFLAGSQPQARAAQ